jgi:hypothetical protein
LTQLSEQEREEGWQLEEREAFTVKVKCYMEDGKKRLDGRRSRIGEHKRTFEVVGDHRCHSYSIELIPSYKTAIQGLREGINNNNNNNNDVIRSQPQSAAAAAAAAAVNKSRPGTSQNHVLGDLDGLDDFLEDNNNHNHSPKKTKAKPSSSVLTTASSHTSFSHTPKVAVTSDGSNNNNNNNNNINKRQNFTFDELFAEEGVTGGVATGATGATGASGGAGATANNNHHVIAEEESPNHHHHHKNKHHRHHHHSNDENV